MFCFKGNKNKANVGETKYISEKILKYKVEKRGSKGARRSLIIQLFIQHLLYASCCFKLKNMAMIRSEKVPFSHCTLFLEEN